MPIMTWSSDLSVGIDSLDEQHKNWIAIINELFDGMKTGKGNDVLNELMVKVITFAKMHFATEEKYMLNTKYEEYLIHKQQHDDFVKRLDQMMERKKAGELALSIELMNTLKEWIVNHVIAVDKKYGPYLKSKGIN